MAHTNPDLLRAGEVAELLGVDPETVRRWTREGRLPAVLLPSGHRRYHRDAIEAMLKPVIAEEPAAS